MKSNEIDLGEEAENNKVIEVSNAHGKNDELPLESAKIDILDVSQGGSNSGEEPETTDQAPVDEGLPVGETKEQAISVLPDTIQEDTRPEAGLSYPELTFGVKIKLPTGQIANFLSFRNPEVEKFLCDVVNNIDIKTPDSFPFSVGLVPVSSSCEPKCPTKHVLFAGTLCEE